MSLRKIIDTAIGDSQGTMFGTIASPFYQVSDLMGSWVWACDVDIGQDKPLVGVPVAANNREILYSEEGKGVTLGRMNSGKWSIIGLSKVVNSLRHYIYMSFEDDMASVVSEETVGFVVRPLTYGELADYGGYGLLPYGAYGKFDAAGTFIKIMGWY